jgi:hypothetical protein
MQFVPVLYVGCWVSIIPAEVCKLYSGAAARATVLCSAEANQYLRAGGPVWVGSAGAASGWDNATVVVGAKATHFDIRKPRNCLSY